MKKTMLAVLCLAMTAMTTMAKDNNKGHKGHMNHPRHEMVDPVINMEVVGQMGLSEKQIQKIAALKEKKQDEMKALRVQRQHKAEKKNHAAVPGQKPMAQKGEFRKDHRTKVQEINTKYRKEMQEIMGTKTYVNYVEKVNDRLAMNRAHGNRHNAHGHKMHRGTRMHHHHEARPQQVPQHKDAEKV